MCLGQDSGVFIRGEPPNKKTTRQRTKQKNETQHTQPKKKVGWALPALSTRTLVLLSRSRSVPEAIAI